MDKKPDSLNRINMWFPQLKESPDYQLLMGVRLARVFEAPPEELYQDILVDQWMRVVCTVKPQKIRLNLVEDALNDSTVQMVNNNPRDIAEFLIRETPLATLVSEVQEELRAGGKA